MAGKGAPKGNQNAVKAKIWSDRLKAQIEERKLWPKLADALLEKALEGDVAALKEVGDRVEGKVSQPIEGNLDTVLTIEIVRYAGETLG